MPVHVPPIRVGDRLVSDPYAVLEDYCAEHRGTLLNYDWLAGTTDSLTSDLVGATRSPWMNSRISNSQGRWFVEHNQDDLWARITKTASLREADPALRGGLYDTAEGVYRHFFQSRPFRVGRGKISKCLYLMRPHLFPILDSRLTKVYREAAREAARRLADLGRPPVRRAYWAAIRCDLLREAQSLQLLREQAQNTGGPVYQAGMRLSDVRLLDILAWSPRKRKVAQ